MQQISDGLLLQPLLDLISSPPAVGVEHYGARDWGDNRQDHLSEGFLAEALTHNTVDHAQRQGLANAVQTGTGGEAVNINREVLEYVRQAAQFEERVNQRLAKIEETLDQWESR
ncbi:hypothetical protein ACHAQH_010047 [Verticillium albo-atrum]